jgi:hypothetical protein
MASSSSPGATKDGNRTDDAERVHTDCAQQPLDDIEPITRLARRVASESTTPPSRLARF